MNLIDKHIIKRSTRSIKCLFLNSDFYKEVKVSGLNAETVFDMKDKYISNVFYKPRDKKKVENTFLRLIKMGILRREVDGQGLTSKVRLTPLGRLIIEEQPNLPNQKPSFSELIINWIIMNLLLK